MLREYSIKPRRLWMVLCPFISINLGLFTWFGISWSEIVVLKLPSLVTYHFIALFGLTGFTALLSWSLVIKYNEHELWRRRPYLVAVIYTVSMICLSFVGILVGNITIYWKVLNSVLSFTFAGLVVGAAFSFIPHVGDRVIDFKTDYLLMSAIPMAGLFVAAVPWTIRVNAVELIFGVMLAFFCSITFSFSLLYYYGVSDIRQYSISEATSLFRFNRRARTTPDPEGFQGETPPISAAWATIRKARPFPAMFSFTLAAYTASFLVTSSLRYDLQVRTLLNISTNASVANCAAYGSANLTVAVFSLPACFVPALIHRFFLKQDQAAILQPILGAIVAFVPALGRHWLGDFLLDFHLSECVWSVNWALLGLTAALGCVRALLVAAAYVDVLYQVYLAAGDLAIPVGSGGVAIVSGSTGVLLGVLNVALVSEEGDWRSWEDVAGVLACPVSLWCCLVCCIVWRRCRPIAIEG